LKWIIERVDGKGGADETPIGYVPKKGALDVSGLNMSDSELNELFKIDKKEWQQEVVGMEEYLKIFQNKVPAGITKELQDLKARLAK
jgi:phosphoenolpyruvate carboxykinase (GTP)